MAMLPTIKSNIPFVMNTLGRSDLAKKDIINKYLQLEGFTHESEFGQPKDKHGRFPFGMTFATCLQKLKKEGVISSPKRGVYSLEDGSLINGSFSSHFTSPTSLPTLPNPKVEVEVDNPAVIEAHIDTTTNELVENVGGSKDYRKPLDKVEDGYITSSSVQITLETVVEVEEEEVELEEAYGEGIGFSEDANLMGIEEMPIEVAPVEVEVAPVVAEDVEEVVEPTLVEETLVEDQIKVNDDLFEDEPLEIELVDDQEDDVQPSYDLQKLRKSTSFDPCSITLKNGLNGSYEVYRDMEARNIVLTQKGRVDYEVIPVDVDLERIKNIPEHGEKYARFAELHMNSFDTAENHKEGCKFLVKALISCCSVCNHTDDFGGFVEPCMSSDRSCVLRSIWAEGSIYVNPQDS